MTTEWKDESSYRRNERGSIEPYCWAITRDGVRLVVHRHIHQPGRWFWSCRDLDVDTSGLKARAADEACREALDAARQEASRVAAALASCTHAPLPPAGAPPEGEKR